MKGRHGFPFRHRRLSFGARTGAAGADGKDIKLGGGVATIQQYLGAELVDDMHIVVSPILL
jgi:dihydrofolate reductase